MYTSHFGLKELPFSITADTSYFFPHAPHQEALNTLLFAIRSGEGFTKVVGEVGTGKTLLCNKLLASLDSATFTCVHLPNALLEPMALLLTIAGQLRMRLRHDISQHEVLRRLTEYMLRASRKERRIVICVDEAQTMPTETLETLRLLSNLETEKSKIVHVVLFGQPELEEILSRPNVRQLRQRITYSCELSPLSLHDTTYYLAHRLRIAGHAGTGLFCSQAISKLYRASGGVPRLTNIVAHKSLLAAYGQGAHQITTEHVDAAIEDTDALGHRRIARRRRSFGFSRGLFATLFAGLAALLWSDTS